MKNTKKKYKTLKDFLKPFAIGFTSLSILGGIVKYLDAALHMGRSESGMPLVTILLVSLVVIIFDLYCFSGDYIRWKYKRNGIRLEGYIDSAKESFNGRGENRYYLDISFEDNGKKVRHTEAYIGNPNNKLTSRKCSVYKYGDKYIESDFDTKRAEGVFMKIPIRH